MRTRGRRAKRTETVASWAMLGWMATGLAGCGEGGATATRGAAAAPASTKAARVDPCALITAPDIQRISAYAGAVRRETSSHSVCWWTVDGQRLGVSVSVGRYVPTAFLGGSEVDLGGGIRGRRSDAGCLNQIIQSDDTAITLILDGTALRPGSAKGEYRLALGDGRDVDLVEQYESYARLVAERLR